MEIPLTFFVGNQRSKMSISRPSGSKKCHVCGESNTGLIHCDNSDGDNNWVGLCQECCDNLFKKIEEMTKKPV
jgi:hypothetical protein